MVVEDHEDGGVFHQTTQASFVVEGVEESDALNMGQELHGDAAAEEDAAGGHGFEGHVRGFGAEATHENIERLGAHRALARIGEARDHDAGVLGFHRLGDGGKFGAAAGIAEEFVDVFDAHAGGDALGADMDELLDEVFEEGDLEFVARGEVGMATLAGPDMVAVAVPEKPSFAETGAGGDDAAVADGMGRAALDDGKIPGGQVRDAAGVGGEVVEDSDMRDAEFHGDFLGVHAPREVGGLGAAVRDDAGNSETGGEDRLVLVGEEFAEDGVEAGVARAGIALLTDEREFSPDDMKEGNVRFRAADVAGEDQVGTRGHFQRSSL